MADRPILPRPPASAQEIAAAAFEPQPRTTGLADAARAAAQLATRAAVRSQVYAELREQGAHPEAQRAACDLVGEILPLARAAIEAFERALGEPGPLQPSGEEVILAKIRASVGSRRRPTNPHFAAVEKELAPRGVGFPEVSGAYSLASPRRGAK